MSGAMLKQMMEEATAFLKEEKYEKALDAARRVSQFNASNFPALMCVGVASFHLKQWEDAETALRRAADLKPELPAPWKNLVDLYDATSDGVKKIEVLEKLIGVFRSGNKIKPSQKWIFELATTAMSLKIYGKAFDAWYSLVDEKQGVSVDNEANDELPSSLEIWLSIVDLIQLPAFTLSDAKTPGVSMDALADQFAGVARRWNWADSSAETEKLRGKTDIALAMFVRYQLNEVRSTKAAKAKQTQLKKLDDLTSSVIEWFPMSKLAAEYLLVRCEDEDSPISDIQSISIAAQLRERYPKSPMSLMFQGFAISGSDPMKAREMLHEGLASCSAAAFHEGSLCVRAQMELAHIALLARDVEGCLVRVQKAQDVVAEKTGLLGSASPKSTAYSDIKVQLLRAHAHDLAGASSAALEAFMHVVTAARSTGDAEALCAASVGAGELLCSTDRPNEAVELLNGAIGESTMEAQHLALLRCSLGWAMYLLEDIDTAKTLLEQNQSQISSAVDRARALKRLAIVYWHVGGTFRSDKAACFGSLLQAAKLSPSDGEIFAWLGRWYKDIAVDVARAEKCFVKALALAPLNELAGVALSDIYEQQGKAELNVKLWQDLTEAPESAPTWALLRLAQHLVDQDNEDAVTKLHLVLRNEPLNSTYWVAMGHVYRHFGKQVAAQRSYLRAIELGETGWCVLTELARIEGSLHLFEDAIERVQQANEDAHEAPKDIISTVHAELLFEQSKYFNGEGLYGRAATNIKKAAALLKRVAGASSAVPVFKLLGDIHSFAFYLSPLDFADESWLDFLSHGREAYEKVVQSVSRDSHQALAQAHYDIGVSCWYQARAVYSIRGKRYNAFALQNDLNTIDEAVQYLDDARKHLRQALNYDETFALAWNALGVVLKHPLAKQLAWARAIKSSNIDSAWANLGMLYVHHRHGDLRTTDLARNAFLHLQAVNTNNPAMWIGYGMIHLSQKNRYDHRKAREAFRCALEMGYHLDALQGVVLSTLVSHQNADEDEIPSLEFVQFGIKKYLEREPEDPVGWALLSATQCKLGLLGHAVESSRKSEELLHGEANDAIAHNNTILSAAQKIKNQEDDTNGYESLMNALSGTPTARLVIEAQHLYSKSDLLRALNSSRQATEVATPSEHAAVTSFTLALCALAVGVHRNESLDIAAVALAVVNNRVESGLVTIQEIEAAEGFLRAAGSLPDFVSLADGIHAGCAKDVRDFITMRWRLAQLDLAVPPVTKNMFGGVDDSLHLSALTSLLTANGLSPMKLVRAEPWNPAAYALAALCVYKRAVLAEALSDSADLTAAVRLLEIGLGIAKSSPVVPSLPIMLLHWAFALVHKRLNPDDASVKNHVDEALKCLNSSDAPALDKRLWDARIHSLVDQSTAMAKYAEALNLAQPTCNTNVALAILYELGGVCESSGLLDAAHLVWKTVMTWKSEDTEGFNTTGFVGNLHLAIVHATKQNTKSAKKFSKSAVALATAGDEGNDTAMATTARFVESVIAKM